MEALHPLSQKTLEASDTRVPVLTWPLGQHTVLFRTLTQPVTYFLSTLSCYLVHFLPCIFPFLILLLPSTLTYSCLVNFQPVPKGHL
jgi:hypothetical protein